MIHDKRKVFRTGKYTRAISLPSKLMIGKIATLAADRLILVDPRGEITDIELLKFMEKYIEPNLWSWVKEREQPSRESFPPSEGRDRGG